MLDNKGFDLWKQIKKCMRIRVVLRTAGDKERATVNYTDKSTVA